MNYIQIVSDLHIEYKNDSIPDPLSFITPSADILVLAGDIGSIYKYDQLYFFLSKLCKYFKYVIYVPGNHEYYTIDNIKPKKMDELIETLFSLEKKINNLRILNRSSLIINNICIIGCTLWSELKTSLPKFIVRIHDMETKDYTDIYKKDLEYINNMVRYCKKNKLKMIVITHHCPTFKVLENTRNRSKFPSLYTSNLDHLLVGNNIPLWICGHTHRNFDFITDTGTRVVSNQLGKPKDNVSDFVSNFVINININ